MGTNRWDTLYKFDTIEIKIQSLRTKTDIIILGQNVLILATVLSAAYKILEIPRLLASNLGISSCMHFRLLEKPEFEHLVTFVKSH